MTDPLTRLRSAEKGSHTAETLTSLIERIKGGECSNELDVAIEIVAFDPEKDEDYGSIRANAAGTKVIYTDRDGRDQTFLAADWSAPANAEKTLAFLLALEHQS